MSDVKATGEQLKVLNNDKKSLIVSASAGSGKTWVLVEYITKLICEKKIPVKRLLVLTFTNAAAGEMKERLLKSIMSKKQDKFLLEQIDDLPTADICTIDAFCQKVIKRNLDKLEIDESFSVLDESGCQKIKLQAFNEATQSFLTTNQEEYSYIYNCFKKNKSAMFDCLGYIKYYLDASNAPGKIIDHILNNQKKIFEDASQYMFNYYNEILNQAQNDLNKLNLSQSNEKYIEFVEKIKENIKILISDNILSLYTNAQKTNLPILPSLRGDAKDEEIASKLSDIKEEIKSVIDGVLKYNFDNLSMIDKITNGTLAVNIIKLYKVYKEKYQNIKGNEDYLDFADIERICSNLLEDFSIASELQESYDYIFVDEYQDTNRLQENLIKNVAKKGRFVAVGDPKQAIYGFRNATMEIMKEDIEINTIDQESEVVYLRGNFRSDKRVLDFVNSIFTVLMRDDNVGINYQETSLLDGQAPYIYGEDKAVEVAVIKEQGNIKEEKNQIYSVKNACIYEKNKDSLEIQTIIAYIDEMLTKQIYDIKQEKWRAVELGDIAILMRGRGEFMQQLENHLQASGYPVIADNKINLTEDAEIQMLINFLKLCLDESNQIAFTSVLLSKIGGMDIGEIVDIATNIENKENLFEVIKTLNNPKVEILYDNLAQFKIESSIFGIRRALELLFDRCDYFAYLSYIDESKKLVVEKFLNYISQSGFDNSVANLISYLENLVLAKASGKDSDNNAINLMTIHGSKGMEFPVVILAGCGKSIYNPSKTPYAINDSLGLVTMEYDFEKLLKIKTPKLDAVKLMAKRREYIDELMIYYVALTRAKNKLILTGSYNTENIKQTESVDFFKGKSYFDWLFMSMSGQAKDSLINLEKYQSSLANYVIIDEVISLKETRKENLIIENDEELTEKIKNYLNYIYPNINLTKIEFKNSVTGLLKLQIDDKDSEGEKSSFDKLNLKNDNNSQYTLAEIGTIYHELLKLIDFNTIENIEDLQFKIKELKDFNYIEETQLQVVDIDILYKDIKILKEITKGNIVYKEKPFMMKLPLSEIIDCDYQDQVLVQGVVDMFCVGDQNILVDYKYTSITDKNKLLKKYSKQLILYSKAIEKAFKIKLNKKYIFSLKNAQIFEFFE